LFRGIILQGFLTRYSLVHAVLLNSLLFGLSHLSLPQLVSGIFLGVFIGWIFLKTQSLIVCIFCHACANALLLSGFTFHSIYVFSGVRFAADTITYQMENVPLLPMWFVLAALGVVMIGVSILNRVLPDKQQHKEIG
jgi:hypothetical protein